MSRRLTNRWRANSRGAFSPRCLARRAARALGRELRYPEEFRRADIFRGQRGICRRSPRNKNNKSFPRAQFLPGLFPDRPSSRRQGLVPFWVPYYALPTASPLLTNDTPAYQQFAQCSRSVRLFDAQVRLKLLCELLDTHSGNNGIFVPLEAF
jgi:hypothetical protein